MNSVSALAVTGRSADPAEPLFAVQKPLESLRKAFGVPWWLVDTVNGEAVPGFGPAVGDLPPHWLELCRQVAQRQRADFIADEEPLLAFAAPIPTATEPRFVAVGLFVSNEVVTNREPDDRRSAAWLQQTLGWSEATAQKWLAEQTPWPPERLRAVSEAILQAQPTEQRTAALENEVNKLSAHLADTYEEISLLHRLARHLRISENHEELCRQALEWLDGALPAESLALELFMQPAADGRPSELAPVFLAQGNCPLDEVAFAELVKRLRPPTQIHTLIVNHPPAGHPMTEFPGLRQLILVPLSEGENLFGWLAAFNHRSGGEFGSPEASLLASVGALLGIHCGNLALYRQQADMLAGVVRALTSAIDAKDPYTCGHSDRVARISVALAAEMGCDRKQLDTLYLSGLLHDVGKIGIDDNVLRKPGKLSDAEYEHIKLHPEIGYRILIDLKQLGEVLPVVRHHHENWNGRGYPLGLAGEQIPFFARIVAVADAFDAMSSDRPYRKGMPDEQLDRIFREGAGRQWDAAVVDAFFQIRGKVRGMTRRDGESAAAEELGRMV